MSLAIKLTQLRVRTLLFGTNVQAFVFKAVLLVPLKRRHKLRIEILEGGGL